MKYFFLITIIFAGVIVYFLFFNNSSSYNHNLVLAGQDMQIEYSETLFARARGLSGRSELENNQGMLFVFPNLDLHSFWMKDMNFAIDILWIDENGIIVDIAQGLGPNTFPKSFKPKQEAKYVLEVPAFWTSTHNIHIGDHLLKESIDKKLL